MVGFFFCEETTQGVRRTPDGDNFSCRKKEQTGVRQDIHMGSGTEFFRQEEQ